jgi:lipid-A-disaccharide synthase-like uncharacterized protein
MNRFRNWLVIGLAGLGLFELQFAYFLSWEIAGRAVGAVGFWHFMVYVLHWSGQ